MTHTVYLTDPQNERIALQLAKLGSGVYELISAEGFETLQWQRLCFDLPATQEEVRNLDFTSSSYSCFGCSEEVEVPGLTIQVVKDWIPSGAAAGSDYRFLAANLEQVQAGLDRLRGQFIDTDEF